MHHIQAIDVRLVLFLTALMWRMVVPVLGDTPPNIVLILTDDQGWTGTSVQIDPRNPDSRSDFHQTPNLEALAAAGMRFSSAYAATVCSPTRAAIQTGKSPAQLQMTDHVARAETGTETFLSYYVGKPLSAPLPRAALPGSEITIAERIRQAYPNYRSAYVGNWGLGHGNSNSERQGYITPTEMGLPRSEDPKRSFTRSRTANAYMEHRVNIAKPFFIQISYAAVHGPSRPRQATLSKYEQLTPGNRHSDPRYAAMTEDLDTAVAMVLDKIEQLGIEDNTYVIYFSDNGARRSSNEPVLFQGKGTLWEGGIRVPMIVKGPGVEPGTSSDVPVNAMDLFTTITDLAGVTDPLPNGVEGASLRPILENGGQLPEGMTSLRREFAENGELFSHFPRYFAGPPQSVVIDGDYKLMKRYGTRTDPESIYLFDRTGDPFEQVDVDHPMNLAEAMPDKTAELLEKLDTWLQAVDAPLPYDVSTNIQLRWEAGQPGPHADAWHSTVDVAYLARETWTHLYDEKRPERVDIDPHQPHLPQHGFRFDGDDGMKRIYFHVSDPPLPEQFDKDHSASFEFWLRLNSMSQPHVLFETGDWERGLSLTIGDADDDGHFDDLRLRAKDKERHIVVTSEFDIFSNPVLDFVHVVAVVSDHEDDRYAEIYVNGALLDRIDGLSGEKSHINWDGWDEAGLGRSRGRGMGANSGFGDLPFNGGNLDGDLAYFGFYNYAINGETVAHNYNTMLDDVDVGIVVTSGAVRSPAQRPTDLSEGAFEDDGAIVIHERNDTLDDPLRVDITPDAGQVYGGGDIRQDDTFLSAGTEFTSYLIHYDPLDDPALAQNVIGTVTFSRAILGILFDQNSLRQTDALLGALGRYPVDTHVLELIEGNSLAVSDDLRTLTLALSAVNDQVVQLRVLTTTVPEPGAGVTLLGLILGLVSAKRRGLSRSAGG